MILRNGYFKERKKEKKSLNDLSVWQLIDSLIYNKKTNLIS